MAQQLTQVGTFTQFRTDTGEAINYTESEFMPRHKEGRASFEGLWLHDEWYAPDGVLSPRPLVLDETEFRSTLGRPVVLDLPIGTTVLGFGEVGDGGLLELDAHQPGTYVLQLTPPFPFQAQTILVTIQ